MKNKKFDKTLFFLSGENTSDNKKALKHLKKVAPKNKSVTFIPSQKFDTKSEFQQLKKDFKKIGYKEFNYFPVDQDFSRTSLTKTLNSDVIFLGGGNTFYFMNSIRKRKLTKLLKDYALAGGILMGLSAGAIIMTPQIHLGGFPREDADTNDVNLNKLKGLKLVNFEVCPHYISSKKTNNDLSAYSSLYHNPVYGLKDGDFICIQGSQIIFNAKMPLFKNGSEIKLI